MPHSAPGSTYICLKTTATTALLLVRTILKPKVQGSAHDIISFSLATTFSYVIMLACESAEGVHAIVCNMPQPACRAGTSTS